MRISYLSASMVPSRAANSVHVMKMANAFATSGNAVTLYARSGDEAVGSDYAHYAVSSGFEIVKSRWPRIPALGGIVYSATVRYRAKRRPRPDLFYSRHALTLAGAMDLGVPLRLEAHAMPENAAQRAIIGRLLRHPGLTALVTISSALKQAYLREFGFLDDRRVIVAHDGADPPVLCDRGAARAELVRRAPTSIGHAGYVGHLYEGKGMELVERLSSALPDVAFHVVGGTDTDLARWRAHTAGRPNLFFHGYVPHGRVSELIAAFDVVLAPYQRRVSTYGGKRDIAQWMSPLKLFEYMAHGKAMVASDLAVLREVLTHGINALLCDPDDVRAWREAVASLIQDTQLARRLGDRAQTDFAAEYTWQRRAQRVLA